MFKRTFVLTACAVVAVVMVTGGSTQAQMVNVNHLTFSQAVRLPGAVLTPGTYTFEQDLSYLNVVRVMTRDGKRSMFLAFTIPVTRAAKGPMVSFREAPEGTPQQINTWYENGGTKGHQFIYQ